MKIPLYRLRPSLGRLMVPQYILMFGLFVILIAVIHINLVLLGLNLNAAYWLLITIGLFTLMVVNLFLIYTSKSKIMVDFYRDRLELHSKHTRILPANALDIHSSENFIDRIFGTQTIIVNTQKIRGVINARYIVDYMNKLYADRLKYQ